MSSVSTEEPSSEKYWKSDPHPIFRNYNHSYPTELTENSDHHQHFGLCTVDTSQSLSDLNPFEPPLYEYFISLIYLV